MIRKIRNLSFVLLVLCWTVFGTATTSASALGGWYYVGISAQLEGGGVWADCDNPPPMEWCQQVNCDACSDSGEGYEQFCECIPH
jgi:hypothetical protein